VSPVQSLVTAAKTFVAVFFSTLAKLVGIKHRISSARGPRTNGLAEILVQRVSNLVKLYAKDELDIPDILPFCALALRATNHIQLQFSPFELTFGRKMSLGIQVELTDVLRKFPDKQQSYLQWLQHRLRDLHTSVNLNIEENKKQMKQTYDKRKKAEASKWETGDKVLLHDPRVQPGSSQVLIHRQYAGPYFIVDKIQGPKFGVAYKLVDAESGRRIKSLISGDRLKKCTADERSKLNSRLPGIGTESHVKIAERQPTDQSNSDGYVPDIGIEREKNSGNIELYLVLFKDKSRYWCDAVSAELLQEYRLRKSRNRRN